MVTASNFALKIISTINVIVLILLYDEIFFFLLIKPDLLRKWWKSLIQPEAIIKNNYNDRANDKHNS